MKIKSHYALRSPPDPTREAQICNSELIPPLTGLD